MIARPVRWPRIAPPATGQVTDGVPAVTMGVRPGLMPLLFQAVFAMSSMLLSGDTGEKHG